MKTIFHSDRRVGSGPRRAARGRLQRPELLSTAGPRALLNDTYMRRSNLPGEVGPRGSMLGPRPICLHGSRAPSTRKCDCPQSGARSKAGIKTAWLESTP
jgi:hypothetical protein